MSKEKKQGNMLAYFKDNVQTEEDHEEFDASQYYYNRNNEVAGAGGPQQNFLAGGANAGGMGGIGMDGSQHQHGFVGFGAGQGDIGQAGPGVEFGQQSHFAGPQPGMQGFAPNGLGGPGRTPPGMSAIGASNAG
jgi:hypothetical protein